MAEVQVRVSVHGSTRIGQCEGHTQSKTGLLLDRTAVTLDRAEAEPLGDYFTGKIVRPMLRITTKNSEPWTLKSWSLSHRRPQFNLLRPNRDRRRRQVRAVAPVLVRLNLNLAWLFRRLHNQLREPVEE